MTASLRNPFNGGQAGSYEISHILQGFTLNDYQQVKAARHEINSPYFVKAIDALRNGIKSCLSLRCKIYLDNGGYGVAASFFPVNQGVVA